MRATALASMVGLVGYLRAERSPGDGLRFKVRILDTKTAYGKVRYLVEPVDGIGTAWVEDDRLIGLTNDRPGPSAEKWPTKKVPD